MNKNFKQVTDKRGYVNGTVLSNLDITPGARLLYAILCTFADKDGYCFPGVTRLSEEYGVSERQIMRFLKELEDCRVIERIKRYTDTTLTRILL